MLPPATMLAGEPPIEVACQFAQSWQEDGTDVWLVRDATIRQENVSVSARQMVVWRTPITVDGVPAVKMAAYLEGDVQIQNGDRREFEEVSYLELVAPDVRVRSVHPTTQRTSKVEDAVYRRASTLKSDRPEKIVTAQYSQNVPSGGQGLPVLPAPGSPLPLPMNLPPVNAAPATPALSAVRHVAIYPRAIGRGFSMVTQPPDGSIPPEFVTTITGGVRIVVDGIPVEVAGQIYFTTIDLAADRAVIWTDAERVNEFTTNFDIEGQAPFEVFLEGDIVVRQGATVGYGEQAYYDLTERRGLIWNAELQTHLPDSGATVRLRAQQIRQQSYDRFHAKNAWITTSEMGNPGYRFESSDIFIERRPVPGRASIDPSTGLPDNGVTWVTSLNNRLFIENVPVGNVPYISSPAEDPEIPLKRISAGYDKAFGFTVNTVFDADALFGVDLPPNMDWNVMADFYSKRGPGGGTSLEYDHLTSIFGAPVRARGDATINYIYDNGEDRLGQGRNNLPLEDEHRGRGLWRQTLDFPFNTQVISEVGYLSDRNVLEQYWEPEWDTGKDYETLATIKHQHDNFTASLMVRDRMYDFDTTTNWLPKLDLTWLSESVPGTPLLWSSHSSVGYGQLRPADAPFNPATDIFDPLPFVARREGLVAMTRHELDLPLQAGPVNVVPYLLGEAAHWDENLPTGEEVSRLYGSAGVRASVMFSKFMPGVYSPILGLNGLAHKMIFDIDYSYSQSSEDLSNIAQYNEFDENSQERFRTRFLSLAFGGVLPPEFDPRYYAVRSGAGRGVTAPWHELVDDLHVARLGWRHRWQTRTGPPQAPRIVDWMTLDLETSLFPDADQNFGEHVGLITGRYSWNVGARTKFLANGTFDVFDPGQRIWNVGILSQRSSRGSVYVGFRQVEAGPIDSQLLVASMSYHPSEKWAATFGTSFDVAEGIDRGQSATITRIGEYLLFHVGAGYDRSRDSFGVGISVEPKFGSYGAGSTQLSSLLGVPQ